ncbi:hypothetical protein [Vagococcus carniphilus]|uniref:hypothetical protein n=1 Tax=Vagococcus carniphilus TaxID=218144 RepID=UPI0035DA8ED9
MCEQKNNFNYKRENDNRENSRVDYIHLDVMDGIFVPNISFGAKMVNDIKKRTNIFLDCH